MPDLAQDLAQVTIPAHCLSRHVPALLLTHVTNTCCHYGQAASHVPLVRLAGHRHTQSQSINQSGCHTTSCSPSSISHSLLFPAFLIFIMSHDLMSRTCNDSCDFRSSAWLACRWWWGQRPSCIPMWRKPYLGPPTMPSPGVQVQLVASHLFLASSLPLCCHAMLLPGF